jgi:hypothetical protein
MLSSRAVRTACMRYVAGVWWSSLYGGSRHDVHSTVHCALSTVRNVASGTAVSAVMCRPQWLSQAGRSGLIFTAVGLRWHGAIWTWPCMDKCGRQRSMRLSLGLAAGKSVGLAILLHYLCKLHALVSQAVCIICCNQGVQDC